MRISDWSSDVCSSDLRSLDRQPARQARARIAERRGARRLRPMRASLEVADIFRAAGPAYRMAHAGHLSLHQLKIMSAIEHCRTAALGGHVEEIGRAHV